jgi:hypothetical protein
MTFQKHTNLFSRFVTTTLLIYALSLIECSIYAQSSLQQKLNIENENLNYEVVYNWGFIWVPAAEVKISVKKAMYLNKPVYHLEAIGKTLKSYDWFFTVNDYIQTYVDCNTLEPLWSEKKTYEGGYKTYENYVFNYTSNKIFSLTETSKRPLKYDTLKLTPNTFDLLTASFYARSINYSLYKKNDIIPIQVIFDNQKYSLYIRYLGKEQIQLPKSSIVYNCLKFSSLVVPGTIFKGGESLIVWVTDDDYHRAVLAEAKIIVGSVQAYLKSK